MSVGDGTGWPDSGSFHTLCKCTKSYLKVPQSAQVSAREVDPGVAQAEPRRHAAAHRAARERVEDHARGGAEPPVHELAEHRAEDRGALGLRAAEPRVPGGRQRRGLDVGAGPSRAPEAAASFRAAQAVLRGA